MKFTDEMISKDISKAEVARKILESFGSSQSASTVICLLACTEK